MLQCPTVGVAGGYTLNGGHSALSTNFGLAADQTLSFDVVTAGGELVTACKTENSDLYWALRHVHEPSSQKNPEGPRSND